MTRSAADGAEAPAGSSDIARLGEPESFIETMTSRAVHMNEI
jgi:hypothetical protein